MNFYEKNLQVLFQVDEKLATKIFSIHENRRFEVFVDPNDPINVNLLDKEHQAIFYSTKPIDEITQQYNNLLKQYGRYPFLWFYGTSNGLLIKMFLNIDKTLFVFEPHLELLYILLNLLDFTQELESKRLRLFHSPDTTFNTINRIADHHEIKAFLKTYFLEPTNRYYEKFYIEDMKRINRLFVDVIRDVITKEGNSAEDSLIGLDHHLAHIPAMLSSYPLKRLKGKMNTPHAVIVSTGPSLIKQLPLLKKYQNFVTILCVDASLPILQREGIRPDFVFSLERVEATAKFYENLDRDLLKETIFMPTSIVHPKTLENIGKMRKAISMRPFGYTKAFKMDDWGYIGVGMSAANMAFDFAYVMQFQNIVLIGQDLAFGHNGSTHAKGAVYGEEETQYKKNTQIVKGYYGDEVETSATWVLFLNTFIRDIPQVLQEGIHVYNCTEGGAFIEGAEHIPFADFLKRVEQKPKKVMAGEYASKKRQHHLLHRSAKLIDLYIKRLEWIKKECESVFLQIMERVEELERLNEEARLDRIDFDRLANVISEIDRIKDIYEEDRVLRKFSTITSPLIVNAELELARIMVRPSDEEIEKKAKMIEWIYAHKSWLFFLAGAIENILFLLKKHFEESYKKYL